jgi:hypothetical protein
MDMRSICAVVLGAAFLLAAAIVASFAECGRSNCDDQVRIIDPLCQVSPNEVIDPLCPRAMSPMTMPYYESRRY